MASLIGRVCAVYRLQIAQELGLGSSGFKTPRYLRIRAAFQQPSHYIGVVVPQPAHSNQSGSWSVEQAMAASHVGPGQDFRKFDSKFAVARSEGAAEERRDLLALVGTEVTNLRRGGRPW